MTHASSTCTGGFPGNVTVADTGPSDTSSCQNSLLAKLLSLGLGSSPIGFPAGTLAD